jgi:hypothetical protein
MDRVFATEGRPDSFSASGDFEAVEPPRSSKGARLKAKRRT